MSIVSDVLPACDPWWYCPDGLYRRFYDDWWHVRTPDQMSEDEKLAAVPWDQGN